jgi:RNA polymerase sigma-70 factor (ECF subfamily)
MTQPLEPPSHGSVRDGDHTSVLLGRIREGDGAAREALFARYLPVLRRWASRRLPATARDVRDTDDLVQDTLLRALQRIGSFEYRGEGAFLAYLRQILMNRVRDELRHALERPARDPLTESQPGAAPTALDEVIGRERIERFERALATLEPEQREAVVLRLEFGFAHQQVAEALGKPSANAARMTVARALVDLAKAMRDA